MASGPELNAGPEVQWTTGPSVVTTSTAPRHMRFVPMTLDEIDEMKSAGNSIDIAFFGIGFGAFLTVAVTLLTVPLSDVTHGIFVGLAVLFGLASAYCATNAIKAHRKWKRKIERYEKMAQVLVD